MKHKINLSDPDEVKESIEQVWKTSIPDPDGIQNGYIGNGWYVIDGKDFVRIQGWELIKKLRRDLHD
jgi:hypothetical protein